MAEPARSRRSALKTIAVLVTGAAGLWRFLTPRRGSAGSEPIIVPAAEIPAGGALVLPQSGVALVREGSALIALDIVCTHLGCTVKATAGGFACPCHGSRFDRRGEILAGAASRPLRRLHAEEKGGVVHVAFESRDFEAGES